MKKGDYVAIWLNDQYAREFLGGLPAPNPSRWVVAGELQDEESDIGLWVSIDRAEERRTETHRVFYRVTPKICVVRFDGIITIQRVKKGTPVEIGIRSDQEKEG